MSLNLKKAIAEAVEENTFNFKNAIENELNTRLNEAINTCRFHILETHDVQRMNEGAKKEKKEEKKDIEESEYEEFFKSALKKFGVSNPGELESEEKKKEFFNYVDKNFKGKNEGVKKKVSEDKHLNPDGTPKPIPVNPPKPGGLPKPTMLSASNSRRRRKQKKVSESYDSPTDSEKKLKKLLKGTDVEKVFKKLRQMSVSPSGLGYYPTKAKLDPKQATLDRPAKLSGQGGLAGSVVTIEKLLKQYNGDINQVANYIKKNKNTIEKAIFKIEHESDVLSRLIKKYS